MSNNISLKIFTPSGLEREEIVSSVTLPSANGEIQILPGHAKYVGLLGTGILSYMKVAGGANEKLIISEGISRFENNSLDILADVVFTSSNSLPDNASTKRSGLEKVLASTSATSPEWQAAKVEIAKIDALEKFRAVH